MRWTARNVMYTTAVGAALFCCCMGAIGAGTDDDPEPVRTPQRIVNTPVATEVTTPQPVPTASVPSPSAPRTTPPAPVEPAPTTEEPAEPDPRNRYYANCTQAREAGAGPMFEGQHDGYRRALDRDNDGVACELN